MIGAGPGGYVAAIRCAQLGLKTACIEKRSTLGGTCLNVGCIPSKVLLHDTEHSSQWPQIQARKNQVVATFAKGVEGLFKEHGVEWIRSTARFKDPHHLEVEGKIIEAKWIILATGSEPISLPFLPFDEKRILSSTGALSLPAPPQKMLIIGAGIIGVELGSVYRRLGTEVIIIEFLDRICPGFDRALAQGLQKALSAQGIVFHLSHKVVKAEGTTLTAQGPNETITLTGDVVLVAVGRRPYTQDLNLSAVSIQTDAKGFIPIDASFRTTQPHIFAIGDLVDGPMLAHKASEEGMALAELLAGQRPEINYMAIPNVAYTHPEMAAVGFTEEELKLRQIPYRTGIRFFKANSRAPCINDTEGFVKILAHHQTHQLLGIHILGPCASELIAEGALALQLKATAEELAATCHPHPTLSEALKEAAKLI